MRTALWTIWLTLLLGTPYFVENGYDGPALSPLYSWVALGLLAGLAASPYTEARRRAVCLTPEREKLAARREKRLFAGGLALCIASVAPEFLCLPAYGPEDLEASVIFNLLWALPFELDLGTFATIRHIALLASGALCALAVPSLFAAEDACTTRDASSPASRAAAALETAAFFVLGVALRALWLLIMPNDFSATAAFHGIDFSFPPSRLLMLAPLFATGLAATAMSWGACTARAAKLCPAYDRVFALQTCVGSLALGTAAWSLATRCVVVRAAVDSFGAKALLVAAAVLLVALAACLARSQHDVGTNIQADSTAAAKEPEKAPAHASAEDPAAHAWSALGLSPREEQVARAIVSGSTSTEAAQSLGISASTVRSTMYRVYQKAGCKGREELVQLVADRPNGETKASLVENSIAAPDAASATPTASDFESSSHTHREAAAYARHALRLCLLCLCVLYVPHSSVIVPWGTEREVIMGTATGLVGYVLVSWYRKQTARGSASPDVESATSRPCTGLRVARRIALGAALIAASCGAALFATEQIRTVSYDLGTSFSLAGFLAYAALTSALLCAAHCASAPNIDEMPATLRELIASGLLLAVFSLATLLAKTPVLLCGGASIAAAVFLAISPTATTESPALPQVPPQQSYPADALHAQEALVCCAVTGLCLGIGFEELWHSLGVFTLQVAVLPLCALIVASALAQRDGTRTSSALLVSALPAIAIFAATLNLFCAIFVVGVAAFTAALTPRSLPPALAGYGVGMLAGMYVSNLLGDYMGTFAFAVASIFGSNLAYNVVLTAGASVLLALGGATHYRYLSLKRREELAARLAAEQSPAQDARRQAAYLTARGLSDLQVRVLLRTVQGQMPAVIAEELHYSRSTVKAAKRAALLQLGVANTAELLELLQNALQ